MSEDVSVSTAAAKSEAGAGRTAMRGGVVMLAGQGGKFVVQTVSLVVLARILGPLDYGRVAEITAIVGIANLLSDGGLSLAALQARALTQQQRSNLFWSNTAVGLFLGVVAAIAAYPIAAFYRDSTLIPLTQVLAIVFVLSGLQTQFRAHVNTQLRFRRLASTDVVGSALGLACGIVAALAGLGAWALVVMQLVSTSYGLVVIGWSARWRPSRPRRVEGMRALYTFGLNSLANQVLNYLSTNVAAIVLGRVGGAVQLGYYNRAYNLFTLPMLQLAAPMTRVALPIMSRDQDRVVLERRLRKAQTLLSWVLVGVFASIAGSANSFVVVVFGPRWAPSVPIFQVLAIGGVFQAIAYVYYWAFLTTANTRTQLKIAAPARVLMVALVFPLSTFGGIGVAWSLTVGLFVIWIVQSTFGMRAIGLRSGPLIAAAARPFVVFAIAAGLQQLVHLATAGLPPLGQLALSFATVAVVVALAVALVPAVRRDVATIRGAARLARKRDRTPRRRPVPVG